MTLPITSLDILLPLRQDKAGKVPLWTILGLP